MNREQQIEEIKKIADVSEPAIKSILYSVMGALYSKREKVLCEYLGIYNRKEIELLNFEIRNQMKLKEMKK
jgi:hypothetical protein